MWVTLERLAAQANRLKERAHLLHLLVPTPDTMYDERFAYDFAHRHARVERRVWILEDHLDVSAKPEHLGTRHVGEVGTLEQNSPLGRLLEPHDRTTERRLATARLADQAERLTRTHRE